jgi:hypothetical protein
VESVNEDAVIGKACCPELATAAEHSGMCNIFPFVLNL